MKAFVLASLALVLLPIPSAAADSQEESAQQVAALFRSFRKAIVMNPPSIHEPGSFFSNPQNRMMINAQAKSFYRAFLGSPYPEGSGGLHGKMEEALETVMERVAGGGDALQWAGSNDYVKKWDGKLLPARFAGMLAGEFNRRTEGSATIKLTTAPGLLVNESNAPDGWETGVISTKMVDSNTANQQTYSETVDGVFRLMLGEYYGQGCIGCHGTGPGQEGPSIHPSDMARKMGDFAGAISISIKSSPAAGQ